MTTSFKDKVNSFYRNANPVSWFLPVTLANGSSVDTLTCRCHSCQVPLAEEKVRGNISRSMKGFRMTAFGHCEECNLLTPFIYDILPDGDGFIIGGISRISGWGEGRVIPVDFVNKKRLAG